MPQFMPAETNESVSVDFTESFDDRKRYGFEPYGNLLLVELHAQERVTKGGIHLAENAVPKPNIATVIAVGMGQRSGLNGTRIAPDSHKGDVLIIRPFGVTTMKFKGDLELSIISENDVMLRVFEEDELGEGGMTDEQAALAAGVAESLQL